MLNKLIITWIHVSHFDTSEQGPWNSTTTPLSEGKVRLAHNVKVRLMIKTIPVMFDQKKTLARHFLNSESPLVKIFKKTPKVLTRRGNSLCRIFKTRESIAVDHQPFGNMVKYTRH